MSIRISDSPQKPQKPETARKLFSKDQSFLQTLHSEKYSHLTESEFKQKVPQIWMTLGQEQREKYENQHKKELDDYLVENENYERKLVEQRNQEDNQNIDEKDDHQEHHQKEIKSTKKQNKSHQKHQDHDLHEINESQSKNQHDVKSSIKRHYNSNQNKEVFVEQDDKDNLKNEVQKISVKKSSRKLVHKVSEDSENEYIIEKEDKKSKTPNKQMKASTSTKKEESKQKEDKKQKMKSVQKEEEEVYMTTRRSKYILNQGRVGSPDKEQHNYKETSQDEHSEEKHKSKSVNKSSNKKGPIKNSSKK